MRTNFATKTSQSASVQALLADIRKYPMLSKEEEVEAFKAYYNGDKSQKERILNANLRFLFSFANHYANGTDKVLDIFNEMYISYVRAFDTFDLSKGYRFISYAANVMGKDMVEYYSNESLVRKTNSHLFNNLPNKIREDFFKENEREATDEEVMEIMESMGKKVKDISYISKGGVASINDTASADEDADESGEVGDMALRMADSNEYEAEIEREDAESQVATFLAVLPTRDRQIVEMVVLKGMDKDDVAEQMGMTSERVRQIVKGSIAKMQTKARNMGYKIG